jgi:hypothetical protein
MKYLHHSFIQMFFIKLGYMFRLHAVILRPFLQENVEGKVFIILFFSGEGPRSRRYGRAAAMTLIVQAYDEYADDDYVLSFS